MRPDESLENNSSVESSLNLRRTWLPFGFASQYELRARLPAHGISALADGCLKLLLPALGGSSLRDFKGRDSYNEFQHLAPELRPGPDELLFAAGRVCLATGASDELFSEAEDFQVRLHTKFIEFEGAHHIHYDLQEERSGALPDFVRTDLLGCSFPMELSEFRFGVELFQSRFMTGALGYTPVVFQRLLIECSRQDLRVRIEAEALKERREQPLQRADIFTRLDSILSAGLGFSAAVDYAQRAGGDHNAQRP